MSTNSGQRKQTSHEGEVERLLEIYSSHTHRYPLAEALCDLSPKKALFAEMMKRDLSRFEARLQELEDEEISPDEKTFCILMSSDANGKGYQIGGTNIYIERIMKLGTGLETYCETFDRNIDGEILKKHGGKTTPENVALRWMTPEASAHRTNIVNVLKKSQPHDFPQLRSFEASTLLEAASRNGTIYTTALSRDPRLAKLWFSYKNSMNDSSYSNTDAAAGSSLTKALAKALEASRLLDAAAPCMKYLKLKNRYWLKTGMDAMMKSSVQEMLAQKEEGAMMVELTKAINGASLAISARIDEAKAEAGARGGSVAKGTGGDVEQEGKEGGVSVRKPRHRWLRRMGVDPKQGVDSSTSRPRGEQQHTPLARPPQLPREKAFYQGRQQDIGALRRCGDNGDDFWERYL